MSTRSQISSGRRISTSSISRWSDLQRLAEVFQRGSDDAPRAGGLDHRQRRQSGDSRGVGIEHEPRDIAPPGSTCSLSGRHTDSDRTERGRTQCSQSLRVADARAVYDADPRSANPGGLGDAPEQDVQGRADRHASRSDEARGRSRHGRAAVRQRVRGRVRLRRAGVPRGVRAVRLRRGRRSSTRNSAGSPSTPIRSSPARTARRSRRTCRRGPRRC